MGRESTSLTMKRSLTLRFGGMFNGSHKLTMATVAHIGAAILLRPRILFQRIEDDLKSRLGT